MQPLKDDIRDLLRRRAAEGDGPSAHLLELLKYGALIAKAEGPALVEKLKPHFEAIGQELGAAAFRQDAPAGPAVVNAVFSLISEIRTATAPPSEPAE